MQPPQLRTLLPFQGLRVLPPRWSIPERAAQFRRGQPRAPRCQSPPGRAPVPRRVAQAGSTAWVPQPKRRGNCWRLQELSFGDPPPPPPSKPCLPAPVQPLEPHLISGLQAAPLRGAPDQGECTALGPWGAWGSVCLRKFALSTTWIPLLGVPRPFPEASREGKARDSPAGCWCGLRVGVPGILRPSPYPGHSTASLAEYCGQASQDQAGGAEAVSLCAESPSG